MLVTTPDQFQALVTRLENARWISFDTETTGLNSYGKDRIIGLSFGIPDQGRVHTWYVPVRHERGHRLNLPHGKVFSALRPIFDDPEKTLVGWNAKFDLHFLHADRVPVRATVLDAMLAWHLADENLMDYSLKGLSSRILGKSEIQDDKDLQILLKSEKMNKGDMKNLSPIEAAPYAESDASLTWRMFRQAYQSLKRQGLVDLFYEVCEYARVLERCERKGLKIDPVKCDELIDIAQGRDKELLAVLQGMAGPDFNPDSHVQVRKWLGLKSSAKEVLAEMEDVPGVTELLEYRGHAKALGSFYRPMRDDRDRFNRIHPSYRLHGTVSGRLSESRLMCIPRASSQWLHVKEMIVAANGCRLISTDLSQAEFRLMAHYTQEPDLIAAYCRGDADMHQYLADQIGIDRQSAKTLNFSILYGGGVDTVRRQLGCSLSEAAELLDEYHRTMPRLRKTSYRFQNQAEKQGYVELWSGRRRHFPYVQGERYRTHTAMNNVIQGGVAEIVRKAMLRIDPQLTGDMWMLGQVHDEVLVEAKNRSVKQVAELVKEALETVATFRVPVVADQKIGNSWGEMTPLLS